MKTEFDIASKLQTESGKEELLRNRERKIVRVEVEGYEMSDLVWDGGGGGR